MKKAKNRLAPYWALKSIDALSKYTKIDKEDPLLQALWALKEARMAAMTKPYPGGLQIERKNEKI